MAFGNFGGYPTGGYYPPQQQPVPDQLTYLRQQQMQPMAPVPPAQGAMQPGAIWVPGEAAMKAFPVAPGGSVMIFDTESDVFWIKSADQTGRPHTEEFCYFKRTAAQNPPVQAAQPPQGDYVTRAEFDALRQQIAALTLPVPVTVQKEE